MPSSKNYVRDYKQEYKTESKTRRHNRVLRNRARRAYEKAHGDLPAGVDVDHIDPLSQGGNNDMSNLRPRDANDNRSYPRTPSGKMRGNY